MRWVLVFASSVLMASTPSVYAATKLSVRQWQTEDGLPQNSVTCLLQSRPGYIWFGTYAGLVRFDGVRFTVYDSERHPGLANNRITALFEDRSQGLWIGHETGDITRLDQAGQLEVIGAPSEVARSEIVAIAADAVGDVWAVNLAGWLWRIGGEARAQPPAVSAAPNSYGLVLDAVGNFWCLRRGRLGRVLDGRVEDWVPPGESALPIVQAIAPSHRDGVWIAIGGNVRRLSDGRWAESPSEQPWSAAPIGCLSELRAGGVVVGTRENGVFIASPDGEVLNFSRTNGLGQDWVRCIGTDREGNIWTGLGNGGLSVLRTVVFNPLNPPGRWHGRSVLSLLAARDGSLWVGTEGDGLYRWQSGDQWSRFAESEGLTNRFVWSLCEGREGEILVGTWSGGLFKKSGERFVSALEVENLTQPVTAMLATDTGQIWIGSRQGAGTYAEGRINWLAVPESARVLDVRCIAQAPDGAIWFGMNGAGLARLADNQLRFFRRSDGLGSDFINCLHFDAAGALWCGTAGSGLARYQNGQFARVGLRQGLPSVNITHLQEDGRGYLWLGSSAGVLQVRELDLNACADGTTPTVAVTTYGLGDGLDTTECSGGFQPAGCRTADGQLWFPTRRGLVRTDPQQLTTNTISPPVIIEQFTCQGEAVGGAQFDGKPIVIAPGRSRFEFQFTALSFVAPAKVRFKYRLVGLEPEWLEHVGDRRVGYSYLSPGDYRFEVRACNNDGLWNEASAQLAFTVLPYFWQTLWFRVAVYVASCLAVAGGVLWGMRLRLRRKLEGLERQRAVERERARIAKDIHDDLGASLTRITMLSHTARKELGNAEVVGRNLGRIDGTARELTRAMDEIVWAVNPRHDTLDSLAIYIVRFAQDFLSPGGIRCRVDVPLTLPHWPIGAELRHNVFLAYKEAINNVVRHAQASEVRISLHPLPAGFELSVTDDGIGIQDATQRSATGDSRPLGGNGLRNMQTRMKDIGGTVEILPGAGRGTRIVFTVTVNTQAAK